MTKQTPNDQLDQGTYFASQSHSATAGHDPFAQPAASYGEPLFPAAPANPSGLAMPVATYAGGPEPSIPAAASLPGLPAHPSPSPATRTVPPHAPEWATDELKAALLRSSQPVVADRHPTVNTLGTNFNQRFAVATDLMQHGAWPQALEKLRALQVDYPRASFLEALIDEALLKTDLMQQWAHKIKGRRFTVAQEWLLRRSLPFFALLFLFSAGFIFYQNFVAPSRLVVAMARVNQARVEAATDLVQQGNFVEAVKLYEAVLARDPQNYSAQQGLIEAKRLRGVAVAYDVAMEVAVAGNLARALRLLNSISADAVAFRDVDAKISQLQAQAAAEAIFLEAEKTFGQRRWAAAVAGYEQVQQLSADYKQDVVKQRLSEAYYHAGRTLALHWPTESDAPDQARVYLRNAQNAGIQRDETSRLLTELDIYLKGLHSLENNSVGQAINAWQGLLDARPDLLGGYVVEQLYRAYLTLAGEVSAADPDYARQLYEAAARLPVQDPSEARRQLTAVGVAVPTPAPTPTATPVPQPAVAVAPAAAPAPAEPTPTPANSYQGWIAFRTQRNGSEQVFVMRTDGAEQQPAPEELRSRLDTLYQAQRSTADGSRQVYVQSATGRSDANIFVTNNNGETRMLTDFNMDEYDPVWSPDEQAIAFVANHTGNDEIWIMQADGSSPRQLTFNEWQWDKHPTWSADGSQIAFFSNRTGQRQIWLMGRDGANVRNLSNNVYDDWDPVWIR